MTTQLERAYQRADRRVSARSLLACSFSGWRATAWRCSSAVCRIPPLARLSSVAAAGCSSSCLATRPAVCVRLTDRDAEEMLDEIRGVARLRGHRGKPVADEAALRDALVRVAALLHACPEIREMDINPLNVRTLASLRLTSAFAWRHRRRRGRRVACVTELSDHVRR